MAREIGIDAVLKPNVDDRTADRQASRLNSKLSKAAELTPDINTRGLRSKLERAIPGAGIASSMMSTASSIGSGPSGGRDGGRSAGGGGGLDGGSAVTGILGNQLDVQKDILRQLKKQGADRAMRGGDGDGNLLEGLLAGGAGGAAAAKGLGSGLLSKLVVGAKGLGGSLRSGGQRAIGGAKDIGGRVRGGGRGVVGKAGGLASMVAGIPAMLAGQQTERAREKEPDERNVIEQWLAEQLNNALGGSAMALGDTGMGDAVASIVVSGLQQEAQNLPSLTDALAVNSLPTMRSAFNVNSVPSLDDALDMGEMPTLEDTIGTPEEYMEQVNNAFEGMGEIDLRGDLDDLGQQIVEGLGDPENVFDVEAPVNVDVQDLDALESRLNEEITSIRDELDGIVDRIENGVFGR